ncbi:MAG TPA: hypothetical protein VKV26_08925, partial [Dehalococcoidia bacterium]|nr:hypothetical protein [Dehalococcoidia bacterium]
TRTVDPETGEWRSELRAGFADGGATVADRLQRFAALDLERKRKPGTGRPKPACPHCGDEAERGWVCRGCNAVVDEQPLNGKNSHSDGEGPDAADCVDSRIYTGNFSHSDGQGWKNSASDEPPNVTPMRRVRTSQRCAEPDCDGYLLWDGAGCWVCEACGTLSGYAVREDAPAGAAAGGD